MNVRIRILEWRAMRRFFNLVLGGLAMVVVAMVSLVFWDKGIL